MDKFKGYLICTDCDGTLTDSQGRISDENAEAIRYFQSEGGLFTLATGRFPNHLDKYKDKLKINAPIVSLNGSLLYDTQKGEIIAKWPMNKAECIPVLKYIQKEWGQVWECWLNFNQSEGICYKPQENKPDDGSIEKLLGNLPDTLYKNVFMQPEHVTKAMQKDLREKFGDRFRFDSSWPEGLEMQSIESSKGIAIRYMKEHLDVDIHTTIGVGDYENDLSMMECADIGYAVGNAIDEVKKASTYVTVTNDEHALAKIISEIDKTK